MSLRSPVGYVIPEETARIARAIFPKGTPFMRMVDTFGPLFTNADFRALYPPDGQPAYDPARLALVILMQLAEGLTDRQAADAVRRCIDWKYVLALELTDVGFDASILSEFRDRLLAHEAETQLFDAVLMCAREEGLLTVRGQQRTDSTHVCAAIRLINRLECIGETLRHALNTLAQLVPAWLHTWVPTEWFERYARRFDAYRFPKAAQQRAALAAQLGTDGQALLDALDAAENLAWAREIPAVKLLRTVWNQQFFPRRADEPMQLRPAQALPPAAEMINSPYDPDARYGKKRTTEWVGYKVHVSETCDDGQPNLITDITVTHAAVSDCSMTSQIQERLIARGVAPSMQLVDAGYISATNLSDSQTKHQIDLVGPTHGDGSWQAVKNEGYDAAHFTIDWEAQTATCPQGVSSTNWLSQQDKQDRPLVYITFPSARCRACANRTQCTKAKTAPRSIRILDRVPYDALEKARAREETDVYRSRYKRRAGVEGAVSQQVAHGGRRGRYRGEAKTRLFQVLLATAINVLRLAAWIAKIPQAKTRISPFAALAPV